MNNYYVNVFYYIFTFKFLDDSTREAEVTLWNKLFDAGVYITPGKAFHCVEPGWFRIVFAETTSLLKLGWLFKFYSSCVICFIVALQRMQVALDKVRDKVAGKN